MKKIILTCSLLMLTVAMAMAITKSQVVVYIGGVKYYVHTVEPKETIYSLAKAYQVSEQEIIDANSATLKAGEKIKIPFSSAALATEQKESGGALRNLFTFSKHTIGKGDTLYSISRKYEISIDTIIEDNPSIDPISLPIGEKLLIRKKMKGRSSEKQSQREWEEYRADLNLTTEDEHYQYHIVKKGETIYSLSKEAGVSESDFIALNELRDGLKAGSIIKMPTEGFESGSTEQEQLNEEPIEQKSMRSLSHSDTLRVALLLPLSNQESVYRQFGDFYKGFEMGLDSVRIKWGRNIELKLFNTERNAQSVEQIVQSEQFEGTNLIVGPVYEEQLAAVLAYAERTGTPIVSPLATLKQSSSSVLFQMAPPTDSRYDKALDMLADGKHITLIYTEKQDDAFEAQILELLGERPYDTHNYIYEHPNEVAEKLKKEEESAGDLSKFINNGKDNTIIVLSQSETDVDRILSALSSAQINIVARGGATPQYKVLGNPEWSRYQNIDRTILFKNNVVLLSSYHAKRDNRIVRIFDSNFIKRHRTLPTLYAYRGYDAAMIFGEAIYSDMEYNLEGRKYRPLQSNYRFESDPTTQIHTNTEWIRVNYNSNYTITIE